MRLKGHQVAQDFWLFLLVHRTAIVVVLFVLRVRGLLRVRLRRVAVIIRSHRRRQLRRKQELVLLEFLLYALDHVGEVHALWHLLVDWIEARAAVLEVRVVLVQMNIAIFALAVVLEKVLAPLRGRWGIEIGDGARRVVHIEPSR